MANQQFGHVQGAAAVGYDGGTLLVLPKNETRESANLRGFCAVTTIGSGESIRRDSSAHLDPLHSLACTSSTWGRSRLLPCSCPARPCWRRPLEREPAQVAPENAKAVTWAGGSNTLNTATVGGCSSHRPCWLHTPAPSGENHGQSTKPAHAAGKGTLCPAHHPPTIQRMRRGEQ